MKTFCSDDCIHEKNMNIVLVLLLMSRLTSGQVFGGRDARQGQFKYAVLVTHSAEEDDEEDQCAGSIIHENWVVTAAHCIDRSLLLRQIKPSIVAGDIWVEKKDRGREKSRHREEYNASDVIIHPAYDKDIDTFDLALLYFEKDITESDNAEVISIQPENPHRHQEYTVMGWGNTDLVESEEDGKPKWVQGQPADRLQYAEVYAMGAADFSEKKKKRLDVQTVEVDGKKYTGQKIYVTWRVRGGPRTMKGDSGGPLVCSNLHGVDVLYGVLRGFKGKTKPQYAGRALEVDT